MVMLHDTQHIIDLCYTRTKCYRNTGLKETDNYYWQNQSFIATLSLKTDDIDIPPYVKRCLRTHFFSYFDLCAVSTQVFDFSKVRVK